jgi:hypothetical protein
MLVRIIERKRSSMQSNSSGLLESVAVSLLCIVVLAAIYRRSGDDVVCCGAPSVAIAPEPAAHPVQPVDARMEAEIKDMLLHD